jgi:hypothetical protein
LARGSDLEVNGGEVRRVRFGVVTGGVDETPRRLRCFPVRFP